MLSVAAGDAHCLAVAKRGAAFSWGSDAFGQCGYGSSSGQQLQQLLPRRVDALTGVRGRNVSAGTFHSLVVTEEGVLYSFCFGHHGQLGQGSENNELFPMVVDALRHVRIAAAAAEYKHTLALAEDGTVSSWGSNSDG